MGVNPGRFDQPLRLERAITERNSFGELEITGWDLIAEPWGKVDHTNSRADQREAALAGRPATERVIDFTLRHPLDIRAGDRLIWNGDAYGVEGFVPLPRAGVIYVTGRFLAGTDGR